MYGCVWVGVGVCLGGDACACVFVGVCVGVCVYVWLLIFKLMYFLFQTQTPDSSFSPFRARGERKFFK